MPQRRADEIMQFKVYPSQDPGLNTGTNDSSIVSKRSVERSGYDIKSSHHQWLRYFVKKPARRAPLINLGYFIRMKAVEKVIDEVDPSRNSVLTAGSSLLSQLLERNWS